MKIIVTGANGQLGMTFQALATEYPEHEFFFYASKELDITEPASIEAAFFYPFINSYLPLMVNICLKYEIPCFICALDPRYYSSYWYNIP